LSLFEKYQPPQSLAPQFMAAESIKVNKLTISLLYRKLYNDSKNAQ